MRIAVVGAGAMGSLFGGLLAESGAEVRLLDVWEEHVAALNARGLTIDRVKRRLSMLDQLDRMRRGLAQNRSMEAMDSFSQQAVDMITGHRVQNAFDLEREPAATRDRFGFDDPALDVDALVESLDGLSDPPIGHLPLFCRRSRWDHVTRRDLQVEGGREGVQHLRRELRVCAPGCRE